MKEAWKDVIGMEWEEDEVTAAGYDRQAVADHAENLATKIRKNLTSSLKSLGVDILTGVGTVVVKYGKAGSSETLVTAKDIIIATGSVPFVPKGVEVDGKTVITSDHALKLETVPEWIVIVGSGYIGLEFNAVAVFATPLCGKKYAYVLVLHCIIHLLFNTFEFFHANDITQVAKLEVIERLS
ncbi:hypothetical protein L1987_70945 [Smallanthus sonchifolius]|uniref:Uncharacterized protein n=1 Tax=Smallanthus sonchifolius TaxID=185202 RepID=A0ACB9AVD3_9ASTR|nr:hypothetical protein L1987_70945 [Smallanthus sonchifolius]